MKQVFINRNPSSEKQTLGNIVVPEFNWTAKTLELPWLQNKNNISCIPDGEYICKYTRSVRLSKLKGHDFFTYEILNVPGRAGIRIHAANFFNQLLGCVALGSALKDLNVDQELDVIHSGDTVAAFEKLMDYQDFKLIIKTAA